MTQKPSILQRWGITEAQLTELVDQNPSLRGIMLGYVAEKKFHDTLVPVTWPPKPLFTDNPFSLLDELGRERDIPAPTVEEKTVQQVEVVDVVKVQDKS